MNILVTGGAGFIGSHLTEYLLNQGHRVIVLDNFFTGSRDNLRHLEDNNNLIIIEEDIANNLNKIYADLERIDVDKYPSVSLRSTPPLNSNLPVENWKGRIDQIYNLACPASPVHYQRDPVETVRANVIGMINMLELAKKTGARILQASTSEIYGDPKEHPQKESYLGHVNCIGPRACYDEGKRCAETLCFDYHRQYGIDIKVARIFNTYGPRMAIDDGRVISNFIVAALRANDLIIYGDGKGTRSFQYVDDLILGIVKMMEVNKFIGPVNLGNPEEFSIKQLADKVLDLVGSKSKITYSAKLLDDPIRRKPDISLAKEKLGWQPKVELEEGLKKTIAYFKKQLTVNPLATPEHSDGGRGS